MFILKRIRFSLINGLFFAVTSFACLNAFEVPARAATLYVPSTQYPTIQSAINAANLGDSIVVEAGRTYTENLVLSHKTTGTGWITIQSSALSSLPTAGNRVGPSDAANMPTIRSTAAGGTSTISTTSGATPSHHYKLIGLNILRHNSTSQQTAVVSLGTGGSSQDTEAEMPSYITIDRCLIRGADGANTRRGVLADAKNLQIINSYIDKFHEAGADAQSIVSLNGGQDVLIANNFLEATGENVMLGGSDPSIPNFVPNNFTIEHNHFYKPMAWKGAEPGPVKNIFELKSARNITVRNNIFENNWIHSQSGYAIVFTPRNQDGGANWTILQNITFEYNIIKNSSRGFNILAADDGNTSQPSDTIIIRHNLVQTVTMGTAPWFMLLIGQNADGVADRVEVYHNTFVSDANAYNYIWYESPDQFLSNHKFNDNIIASLSGNWDGINRSGGPAGTGTLDVAAGSGQWQWNNNVLQRSSTSYPSTSFYASSLASIRFVNPSQRNYELAPTSPYKNAGTDGKDIGADIRGLNQRTACVQSGQRSNCSASRTAHDFDGDGRADISLFRPSEGVWYVNKSRDGFGGLQWGMSTDKIAPADFDGDGKEDFAVYRPVTGEWYVFNSSTNTITGTRFGLAGDLPVQGDYDGDGKADVAVWRPSTGVWYFMHSSNGGFGGMQFGLPGDKPAVGDYDGDGRSDIAVFRPLTGVWYLNRSTAGFAGGQFGLATDKITPADYDGDGKTDIAVYRPSEGVWYMINSSTGQLAGSQWGLAIDIPSPADYDGDGKADLAVYRPTERVWYLNKSTEGFGGLQFGLNGDVPVASVFSY